MDGVQGTLRIRLTHPVDEPEEVTARNLLVKSIVRKHARQIVEELTDLTNGVEPHWIVEFDPI